MELKFIEKQAWSINPSSGDKWANISREERFFCALLFEHIKKDATGFAHWLNLHTDIKFEQSGEWEVGYEVCFYRDWFKAKGQSARKIGFSGKRTFDLCLFSHKTMVIIEAKAQQPFNNKEIKLLIQDRENINGMFNQDYKQVSVNLVALASSKWINKKNDHIKNPFDARITWNQLGELYNDKMLMKADSLYRK